jgi:hypothetical protein
LPDAMVARFPPPAGLDASPQPIQDADGV